MSLECLHLCFFRAGDDEVVDVDVDADQQGGATATLPVHNRFVRALLEAHLLEGAVQLAFQALGACRRP